MGRFGTLLYPACLYHHGINWVEKLCRAQAHQRLQRYGEHDQPGDLGSEPGDQSDAEILLMIEHYIERVDDDFVV